MVFGVAVAINIGCIDGVYYRSPPSRVYECQYVGAAQELI